MNSKWAFKWKSPVLKSKKDFNSADVNEIMTNSIYDLWYEHFNVSRETIEPGTYQRVVRWTIEYIGYHLDYFKCDRDYWISAINAISSDYLKRTGTDILIDDLFNFLTSTIK